MRVTIKERYANELTYEVCRCIAERLNLPLDFEIQYKKGNGRYVLLEHDGFKYYVIVSRLSADARDAFLNQYVTTVLGEYVDDKSFVKKLYVYVLDKSQKAKAKYIVDGYRMLKTMGINILNIDELRMEINPYVTFEDWKNAQDKMREYNKGNNASYAIEDEEGGYTLFGKLYGANGKDAAMTACMLACIAKSNDTFVRFIQVCEHGTEEISSTDKKLLQSFGVIIDSGAIVLKGKATGKDKSTCRHQDEFKYNLWEKYGDKKCYMCSCDIESNIIASHIHRICDIDKSGLPEAEKRRQAVDADNGFWLCANHDKLFEFGNVTYDMCGDLVINPSLKSNQTDFVKYITEKYGIEKAHFTAGLKVYLKIHNNRVHLGI